MRKALAAILLLAVACGTQSVAPTSTFTPTTAPPPPTTSTTKGTQPFETQDCDSPPVTFSPLCEVYELIQRWQLDRPIGPVSMARTALQALREHVPSETAPAPRTLICAIPDGAFAELCPELAAMVNDSAIDVGAAVDDAVVGMTDAIDAFSYYLPPGQVGAFRENGIVGGVGVLLDARDAAGSRCARLAQNCPLLVVFVLEDNPGAEAGLAAGDQIVAVDGAPVEGLGFTAIGSAIAGDQSGSVTLTIERAGETLVFEILRRELTVPTVAVSEPVPGVGYVRIPDFEADIPGLVSEALTVLADARPHTIVIDLRDNPGGFIDAAVEVASQFIDGGVVLTTSAHGESTELTASSGGLATTQRLLVLVNGGTASSAEIVAGALRDRRDAMLVGMPTFGKDAVQIPFELRNGGELFVTVARWSTPSGLTAGPGGLVPERELELPAGVSNEELISAVLEAAS